MHGSLQRRRANESALFIDHLHVIKQHVPGIAVFRLIRRIRNLMAGDVQSFYMGHRLEFYIPEILHRVLLISNRICIAAQIIGNCEAAPTKNSPFILIRESY